MWQSTHEKTFPGLKKEAVWAAWSDVNNWHQWDKETEFAKLESSFQEGGRFVLKPRGGPKVKIRFIRTEPLKGFTDLTQFPLAKMYGIHDMEETMEGLKLTITLRVEGPLTWIWRKIVAEDVAAKADAQMEALAAYAQRERQP